MIKKSYEGFSIIELMVVIAIVAILAALAIPSFNEYFEKSRLRGAADAMIALMANARAESVKRDRGVVVKVGGDAADWCVGANQAANPSSAGAPIPAPTSCDCDVVGACSLGDASSVVDGSGFRGVSISSTGASVTFDPKLGTLDISAISTFVEPSVDLSSSSGRFGLRVTVSALGHVRACVPSGKAPISGYREC